MAAAATAATAAGATATAATAAVAFVPTAAVWPLLLQKYGAAAAIRRHFFIWDTNCVGSL